MSTFTYYSNINYFIKLISSPIIFSNYKTIMSYQTVGVSGFTSSNKIPEYAREYKREYQFIRGINKEFKYLINKLDNLNNGLFESKLTDRIKFNMKRFLRAQEKGKLKDISDFVLPKYDYCFIQEFYLYVDNEYVFIDNIIDLEFFEMVEKIYSKIKIVNLFSDIYGEGFCI